MARVAAVLAVGRSAWQPIRIVVSYAQVTSSQVGASLNVQYPPMLTALAHQLAGFLDVIDGVLGIERLGLNGFHTDWLTQVVLFPLGLTAMALGVFEVERRRSSRDSARKHLAGNVFLIVFVCYLRVCQDSFNAWICRRVLPDLSVLVADDRVACENGTHVIYQALKLFVLVLVSLGVPVAATIVLYRERNAQLRVAKSLKLRGACTTMPCQWASPRAGTQTSAIVQSEYPDHAKRAANPVSVMGTGGRAKIVPKVAREVGFLRPMRFAQGRMEEQIAVARAAATRHKEEQCRLPTAAERGRAHASGQPAQIHQQSGQPPRSDDRARRLRSPARQKELVFRLSEPKTVQTKASTTNAWGIFSFSRGSPTQTTSPRMDHRRSPFSSLVDETIEGNASPRSSSRQLSTQRQAMQVVAKERNITAAQLSQHLNCPDADTKCKESTSSLDAKLGDHKNLTCGTKFKIGFRECRKSLGKYDVSLGFAANSAGPRTLFAQVLKKTFPSSCGTYHSLHIMMMMCFACVLVPVVRGQTVGCGAFDPVADLADNTILGQDGLQSAINNAISSATSQGLETRSTRLDANENVTHTCKIWQGVESGYSGAAIFVQPNIAANFSYSSFVGNEVSEFGLNSGSYHGGAIYAGQSSSINIQRSSFVGNQAGTNAHGGAIHAGRSSSINIRRASFVGNQASEGGWGGAIYAGRYSSINIQRSSFVGNQASWHGGAVYADVFSSINIQRSSIVGNRASIERGGAIYVGRRSSITIQYVSFVGNLAGGATGVQYGERIGNHICADVPTVFAAYDTTFDPFVPASTESVDLNVLAGCEQYPCQPNFGCSYENYSLSCTACVSPLVGRDGIRCELEFTCQPGTECANAGGCTDHSECTPCRNGTVSDGLGECITCSRLGERSNNARTACIPCGAGSEPSSDRSECIPCSKGNFSALGICEPCAPDGTIPTVVPNEHHTACVPCPASTTPSTTGEYCVCDSSSYNVTSANINCHEDVFEEAASQSAAASGCARCGACLDCEDSPKVRPGYVRLNPAMASSSVDHESSAGQYDSRVATVHVFRCKSLQGCFGLDSTDPTVSGCQQNYTGYLCESCVLDFERVASDNVRGCRACSTSTSTSWLVVVAIIAFSAGVVKTRNRLARAIAPDTTQVATVLAVARSAWQPIRIVVSYAQVTSQVGASLNVQFPPVFAEIADRLAGILDVIDMVLGVQCLGLDGFHTQWLTQVVLFPLGLTATALGVFVVERRRSSLDNARKHLAGNLFLIVFVCYPRVCQVSFNAWICRRVLPNLSILVADDRVACENGAHVIYQGLSLVVIVLIALGVPVVALMILYRERQAQPTIPDSLKLRAAEALAITPEEAEFAVNEIRLGSSYGFLVDAFKPNFFYWESMDMLRKFSLLGLILFFERGSVNQIAVSLIISFFFMAAHLIAQPYKLASDNHFRTATELHVFLTIATGLVFRTNLDNPFASQLAVDGSSNVDDDIRRLYEHEAQDRRSNYDAMLLVTFVIFVAGATVVTIVAKMMLVARAMASQSHQDSNSQGTQDTLMRAAYARFRLGLATGSDHMDLVDFIDQLDVNQHVRAGKRLWREKQLVSHLTAGQMSAMLRDIEQRLPKSEAIAYHFTDLDAARVILDQSQGLRASSVGQLGGGVSVCLASPNVLGWNKHGGEDITFCQRVGDELWGSKAHEVLPGMPPTGAHADYGKFHSKLEVLLLVRIPAAQNRDRSRIVPGRDNVYIIDQRNCEPGMGTDTARYYSNLHIERCLVLKSPVTEVDRIKLDTLTSRPHGARVKVQSSRNEYNGMTEVAMKEVESTERIDDDLTQLGNWCPAVTTFTAIVAQPSNGANTVRQFHQALYQRRQNHVLWPEDIARFTSDEMTAGLHSIEQSAPRCYTLAYHYTSAANAKRMCKDGKGIDGNETGGVVTASLQSPVDFGWQKNSGGQFKESAGMAIWGARWRHTHPDKMQAVLVIGIPTEELAENLGTTFPIPEPLLTTDEATGMKYYANAHVYKSYVLDRGTATKKAPATDTDSAEEEQLLKFFAQVDADGDGQITTDEAMRYIREQGIDQDEQSIVSMFDAFDSNGDGTIDLSEFPRLMDAIRRSAAKTTLKSSEGGEQPFRPTVAAGIGDGSSGWQSKPSLASKRQPPSLQTMAVAMRAMTPPRGQKRPPPPLPAVSGASATTVHPLSHPGKFDVERPRPLDTSRHRSQRSMAQLPAINTRSATPHRPLPTSFR